MNTIEIYGVKFLKCDKSDCGWNAGYTPGDLNRHGLEFTAKHDMGIRICNFNNMSNVTPIPFSFKVGVTA
jgi:hypothetical protein